MYICEYMTPAPLTITPDVSLVKARAILDDCRFRHLPVVDKEKKLLGIITDRDLRSAYPSSIMSEKEKAEKLALLRKTPVADIMTCHCVSISPLATLDDALLLFDRDKVGGLPVVDDDGRVCGMFSIRDLMAAYKQLFGVADKGSVLIAVADNGEQGIMGRIVNLLEKHDVSFTRLIRVEEPAGCAKIYLRINTFRVAGVYKLLQADNLTILKAEPEKYNAFEDGREYERGADKL